jgi:hypothetical protein
MIGGQMTPHDLRTGPKALDAVFGAMRDAGLADENTPLSCGMCVDESYLGRN